MVKRLSSSNQGNRFTNKGSRCYRRKAPISQFYRTHFNQGPAPSAQSPQRSSQVPILPRCQYTIGRGLKTDRSLSNRALCEDYFKQQKNSAQPEASLSQASGKPNRQVSSRCQAVTLKGLNCSFNALPGAAFCKRHLNYSGAVVETGSESSSCSPPRSRSSPLSYQSQQEQDNRVAEEEVLVPICRHCKTVALRDCNLCQSYGCKMRALNIVHHAKGFGHSRITPPIDDHEGASSSRRPLVRRRGKSRPPNSRILTLQDILPKLKVCCPKDYGMPPTIPIGMNFYVWDRWWHVKQSLLGAHVGMGLFTVNAIPRGEDLFPYIGPEYDADTYREIQQVMPEIRFYAMMYVNQMDPSTTKEMWIDGGTRHSNLAGYINSIRNDPRRIRPNVGWEYREDGSYSGRFPEGKLNYIMTISIAPISAGEELYTNYDWQGALTVVQRLKARKRDHRGALVQRREEDVTEDDLDNSRHRKGKRPR